MTAISLRKTIRIIFAVFITVAVVAPFTLGCENTIVEPNGTSELATASSDQPKSRGAVKNFVAPLSGDQEVPAVETNATGVAKFQLSKDGMELSYKLNVANIEDVRMAHIHLAAAGENGPVVAWLYPEEGPPPQLIEGRFNGTLAEGTITDDDLVGPLEGDDLAALISAMAMKNTYVNVHTLEHGGGEIRGQIDRGNGVAR